MLKFYTAGRTAPHLGAINAGEDGHPADQWGSDGNKEWFTNDPEKLVELTLMHKWGNDELLKRLLQEAKDTGDMDSIGRIMKPLADSVRMGFTPLSYTDGTGCPLRRRLPCRAAACDSTHDMTFPASAVADTWDIYGPVPG